MLRIFSNIQVITQLYRNPIIGLYCQPDSTLILHYTHIPQQPWPELKELHLETAEVVQCNTMARGSQIEGAATREMRRPLLLTFCVRTGATPMLITWMSCTPDPHTSLHTPQDTHYVHPSHLELCCTIIERDTVNGHNRYDLLWIQLKGLCMKVGFTCHRCCFLTEPFFRLAKLSWESVTEAELLGLWSLPFNSSNHFQSALRSLLWQILLILSQISLVALSQLRILLALFSNPSFCSFPLHFLLSVSK